MKIFTFALAALCLTACDALQKTVDVHWDIDEPTFEAIFGGKTKDCGEIEREEVGEVVTYDDENSVLTLITDHDVYVTKHYDLFEPGASATIIKNDCGFFFRDQNGFKYPAIDGRSLMAK